MTLRRLPQSSTGLKLVETVNTPLGFFVLALLIVESFLATVLVLAELRTEEKMTGMFVGVGLFVFVTVLVAVFSWWKPQHLTFDKNAHLSQQDAKKDSK